MTPGHRDHPDRPTGEPGRPRRARAERRAIRRVGSRRLVYVDGPHTLPGRGDPAAGNRRTGPSEAEAALALARRAIQARQIGTARALVSRAIRLEPDSAEAHTLAGILQECRGTPRAAS